MFTGLFCSAFDAAGECDEGHREGQTERHGLQWSRTVHVIAAGERYRRPLSCQRSETRTTSRAFTTAKACPSHLLARASRLLSAPASESARSRRAAGFDGTGPGSVCSSSPVRPSIFDAWLGTCGFYGCPSPAEIRAFHPSEGGNVYDRNNRLLGHLENVRRVNIPISSVPKYVRDAFVATEDRRFYEHNGLDWYGVLRAVARNLSAGGIRQGFSTITMQVAHNSFLLDRYHGRSLRRKLVELRLSRLLERELTKDQILEHYLNVIYLGNGVNGIEAASLDLFGKHTSQLTLAEGATLAALPKAPSAYTPRRSPARARCTRRNLVLSLMAEQGYISGAQAQRRAQHAPMQIAENEWRPSITTEASGLDAVRTLVDSVMPDLLKEGDVNVYTTLDFTARSARPIARCCVTSRRSRRDARETMGRT